MWGTLTALTCNRWYQIERTSRSGIHCGSWRDRCQIQSHFRLKSFGFHFLYAIQTRRAWLQPMQLRRTSQVAVELHTLQQLSNCMKTLTLGCRWFSLFSACATFRLDVGYVSCSLIVVQLHNADVWRCLGFLLFLSTRVPWMHRNAPPLHHSPSEPPFGHP